MSRKTVALLSCVVASLIIAGCGGEKMIPPLLRLPDADRLVITFAFSSGADIVGTSMDLFQITKDGRFQTPFPSTSGIDEDPEWSNDGTTLVFTSWAPGNTYVPSLWVANADGTGLRRIVVDSTPLPGTTNQQLHGSWSPDRASIAFRREVNVPSTSLVDDNRETGIAVMGADGSGVRWLAPGGDAPSWSSTNRIAFGKDGFIWTVAPDGSGLLRVTSTGGDMYPKWSRDGSTLVFRHVTPSVGTNRRYDIDVVTIRADGSDRRTLVTGAYAVGASWSADGAYVLYDRQDSSDPGQPRCTLHKIPATGGTDVDLTPNRGVGLCGGASWRPM